MFLLFESQFIKNKTLKMSADIFVPSSVNLDHKTLIKVGIAIGAAIPRYETLFMYQAIDDFYNRSLTFPFNATIADVLGEEFINGNGQIEQFKALAERNARTVGGVIKGYIDKLPTDDISMSFLIPAIVFTSLATLFVIARFLVRYFVTGLVRLEDWLIVPALVSRSLQCHPSLDLAIEEILSAYDCTKNLANDGIGECYNRIYNDLFEYVYIYA